MLSNDTTRRHDTTTRHDTTRSFYVHKITFYFGGGGGGTHMTCITINYPNNIMVALYEYESGVTCRYSLCSSCSSSSFARESMPLNLLMLSPAATSLSTHLLCAASDTLHVHKKKHKKHTHKKTQHTNVPKQKHTQRKTFDVKRCHQ